MDQSLSNVRSGHREGLLTLSQCFVDEDEPDKTAENHVQLVVAGEDPPKAFQTAKQPPNFGPSLYNSRSYSQGSLRLRKGGTTG